MADRLDLKLRSLVLFRGLRKDPVIRAFDGLSEAIEDGDLKRCVDTYAAFCSKLFGQGGDFSTYLMNTALEDENLYLMKCVQGEHPDPQLEYLLEHELFVLQGLGAVTSAEIKGRIAYEGFLPDWEKSAEICQGKLYQYKTIHNKKPLNRAVF